MSNNSFKQSDLRLDRTSPVNNTFKCSKRSLIDSATSSPKRTSTASIRGSARDFLQKLSINAHNVCKIKNYLIEFLETWQTWRAYKFRNECSCPRAEMDWQVSVRMLSWTAPIWSIASLLISASSWAIFGFNRNNSSQKFGLPIDGSSPWKKKWLNVFHVLAI